MSKILATLFALSIASPAEAQQPGEVSYHDEATMPAGNTGARIRAVIDAFNAGDAATLRRFFNDDVNGRFRDMVPMEEHEQVWLGSLRRWGAVEFHGIRSYEPPRPSETVVIVRDSNFGEWRALTIRFDRTDGGRIAGVGFGDARRPTNVEAESSLDEDDLLPEIRRLVERSCELDIFSGTVLVANRERELYSKACGEASKRFHVANDIDTRFNLGSMNKMFTSVAIMKLVEGGTIALDDPINRYIDETWLPREITDRVTIHHLLTHTSGLGSYFNQTYMESSRALFRALDDYKPLVVGDDLDFEPGSDWRYSNTGMFLLGVVIESATGEDYFEHIRTNIYEPAGMTRSDSYEMDEPVDNLAIGYEPDPAAIGGFRNNLYEHVIMGGPAGGGFATVGDLHRFAVALQQNALLSSGSLETMWTDHYDSSYGYGFSVQDGPNGKVVGHGGGFTGINSNLDLMVDRGYIVIVMSNYGGAAGPISGAISRLIARVPRPTS